MTDLEEKDLIINCMKSELLNVSDVLYRKRDAITPTKKDYDIVWHKFPDELPDDLQTVLTVAKNPIKNFQYYHVFTFGEKSSLEYMVSKGRKPSQAFVNWCESRHYDVIAWCEIPTYEE